ncbi:peroxidasin homolog, partial [Patiria miniata]|uniref:Ig-like domain-containing protein n=1 Tax=Patiria miniata TaxID=46514 RepID=A0A913ZUE7_PATMI
MALLNNCHSSRSFRIRLLLMGLLILSQEAHSICPSVCRCVGQYASCGNQNLSAIPVGLPDDIRTLYLEHNQLTKLAAGDFFRLSQLEQLYLYNNNITVIEDGAFRGLTRLKSLGLESNNISILTHRTFEGMPNLEELSLQNNRLSSLTTGVFSQAPRLRELNLASNDIGEFPTDISRDLMNVEILDLSYNSASLLLTPVFGQMVALQHLILNNLSAVNNASVVDSIPVPDSAFDGLSNLRKLELNGNRLSKIPAAVKTLLNLISIKLQSNFIQSIDADDFHQPSLLEWLELDNNSLVEIRTSTLAGFPHLTDLYLNYNNLTTIVDGAMNHVNPNVTLELFGNPIRCDCHLRGFAAWLKNNHTGSLKGGRCVTPDRLNDTPVTHLLPNQFACRPRSTSPNATVSVHLGTNALLPCGIDADPILQTSWITNRNETISTDKLKPPFAMVDINGSLLITNVTCSHEGLYVCKVSNGAGSVRNYVELRILYSTLPQEPTDKTHLILETSMLETIVITPTLSGAVAGNKLMISIGITGGISFVMVVLLVVLITIARKRCSNGAAPAPPAP